MASVSGLADCWRRHHEVSMLTAVVARAGRCFGWPPAVKVSMMIMRPPTAAARARQHVGFVGGCGLGGLGRFRARRHSEQLARPCDIGGAIAIGEQSVMADR